jgi:hypothetical protein
MNLGTDTKDVSATLQALTKWPCAVDVQTVDIAEALCSSQDIEEEGMPLLRLEPADAD